MENQLDKDASIKKILLEIMEYCLKINDLGYDTFCEYAGHVNAIWVRVCRRKWQSKESEKETEYLYTSAFVVANAKYIKDIKEILRELKLIESELRRKKWK